MVPGINSPVDAAKVSVLGLSEIPLGYANIYTHEAAHWTVFKAHGRDPSIVIDESYQIPGGENFVEYDNILHEEKGGFVRRYSSQVADAQAVYEDNRNNLNDEFMETGSRWVEIHNEMNTLHSKNLDIMEEENQIMNQIQEELKACGDRKYAEGWDCIDNKELVPRFDELGMERRDIMDYSARLRDEQTEMVVRRDNAMEEFNSLPPSPVKEYFNNNPIGPAEDILVSVAGPYASATLAGIMVSSVISDIRNKTVNGVTVMKSIVGGSMVMRAIRSGGFNIRGDVPSISAKIVEYFPDSAINALPETVKLVIYSGAILGAGLATGHGIRKGISHGYKKIKGRVTNRRMSKAKKQKSRNSVVAT